MAKPIPIKRIIQEGELSLDGAKTSRDIILAAHTNLNSANVADSCGVVLFQAKNGKFYVGTVEFVIDEANPAFVVDTLTDAYAKCPHCGHLQEIDGACPIGAEDTAGDCLCDKCTHICFALTKQQAQNLVKGGQVNKAIAKSQKRRRGGLK